MHHIIENAIRLRNTVDNTTIIDRLFIITDYLYQKELQEVSTSLKLVEEKAGKKYVFLTKILPFWKGHEAYQHSKKQYGSIEFYKQNPLLFLQDNVTGLYHLKTAFILGIVKAQTADILNKFIERRKHLLK